MHLPGSSRGFPHWGRPIGMSHSSKLFSQWGDGGGISSQSLVYIILSQKDAHLGDQLAWINRGCWRGVLSVHRSPDVRLGRFDGDHFHTSGPPTLPHRSPAPLTSIEDVIPRSTPISESDTLFTPFTYGGLSSAFDAMIHAALKFRKFDLFTRSSTDETRGQYLSSWKQWAPRCECMGQIPLLGAHMAGRGAKLWGFLVWKYKTYGRQDGPHIQKF